MCTTLNITWRISIAQKLREACEKLVFLKKKLGRLLAGLIPLEPRKNFGTLWHALDLAAARFLRHSTSSPGALMEAPSFIDLLPEGVRETLARQYEQIERDNFLDDLDEADEQELRKYDKLESLRRAPLDDFTGRMINWMIPFPEHESALRTMREEKLAISRLHRTVPSRHLELRREARREDPEWTSDTLQQLQVKKWIRKKRDRRLVRK